MILFVAGCVCFYVGVKKDKTMDRSWTWIAAAAICLIASLITSN